MKIKLYMDHMSQPSRAVHAFFLISKTPHTIHETRVIKRQNYTPEYLKFNPLATLPCIYDPENQFRLTQSHTIMRYLSRKSPQNAKNWYPGHDSRKLSQIDEYLDFHHTNTRKCHYFIDNFLFAKNKKGHVDEQYQEKFARKNVDDVLDRIQKYFLDGSRQYITGEEPTLADISAFYQIQFLLLVGEDFSRWTLIADWLKRMKKIEQIQQANKIFIKLLPKINPNAKMDLVV